MDFDLYHKDGREKPYVWENVNSLSSVYLAEAALSLMTNNMRMLLVR